MSALLPLRDYQTEALADLQARWERGDTRVPMVLATGLGKTVIFAHLIARWTAEYPGQRAIVLVHTDELVNQAFRKIKSVAPHLSVGIVKAERNEVHARVIVASVQSLRSAGRREQIKRVGLIIVDECHHATARTYRSILDHYGAMPDKHEQRLQNAFEVPPAVKVVGFTATLARGDKAKLSEVWQECTFSRGIAYGIRRGYLLDVRGKRIVVPDLDLSTVKKSGGDYQDAALGDAMDASFAPSVIAAAYAEHAGSRKGIAFWPLVATAEHGAEAFNELGIRSAVVHGGTPREERRLILKRLNAGEIQVVHNCGVLTEGFDDPTVSCIVMARPTKSAPLYQQCVGRGLRPDLSLPVDQRGDCLILDVCGAGSRNDLRTLIDLSERSIPADADPDDLSLMEIEDLAELREMAGVDDEPVESYVGPVQYVEFDPLARKGIGAWLQTEGGTYFLPVGKEAYVLIVPAEDPGLWDVAWLSISPKIFHHFGCPDRRPYSTTASFCLCGGGHVGSQGDVTEHRNLPLDMACSWAEEVVEEIGGPDAWRLAGRKTRWRDNEVSAAQRGMAEKLGIVIDEDATKRSVSDLITTRLASRRIDPVVQFMVQMRG